ncbi:putative membrane protein YphA (DoxX/SURF4 family) [Streptomyces phaeochromogenes]|uniref:hypothetical protein n=1 Tax=Streptomyces TaxID=1883 RepID=UPI00117E35C4|nr:putative membrane protein YphA (DoxX/SURF4 family) [Streptomyces phaeochromogenes]TRO57190.1 hypothetical protein E4K73_43325 [Streptomyces sp. IB201691-2A2]
MAGPLGVGLALVGGFALRLAAVVGTAMMALGDTGVPGSSGPSCRSSAPTAGCADHGSGAGS